MNIWVDADACPRIIKEVLFRAAKRTKTEITLVSNQPLYSISDPLIKKIQVAAGFDVADAKIIECMQKGDLVITADIPLANAVVDKGGFALNPRGTFYTPNNVKQHLATRNLHTELRDSGKMRGGPAILSNKDTERFANSLDKFLASHKK